MDLRLNSKSMTTSASKKDGWIDGKLMRVMAAGPLVRLEIEPEDTSILPKGEMLEVSFGVNEYAELKLSDQDNVQVRPRSGKVFLS
jgi:hypothetical protein